MAGFNEMDTKAYRLVIFCLSLTVFIVTVIMTFKYRAVLSTEDDTLIGMSRGTVIWFYYLNIILAIISFFVFFANLLKILFGKKSIGGLIPKFLFEENQGLFEYPETAVAAAAPAPAAQAAAGADPAAAQPAVAAAQPAVAATQPAPAPAATGAAALAGIRPVAPTAAGGAQPAPAPAGGATGPVPAGGATGPVPAGGATGPAPAGGATGPVPAGGATGPVPAPNPFD